MEIKYMNIEQIYIINLKTDITRRNKMLKLIDKYELSKIATIQFMEAINTYSIDLPPKEFKGSRLAWGCTLSHLKCLKDAKEKNYKKFIIFEDDIILNYKFWEMWKNLPECDLLYLGAFQKNWDNINFKELYYESNFSLGGFAYIILNSIIIERIESLFEIHCKPIDEVLVELQKEVISYVMYPNLCIANLDASYSKNRIITMKNYSNKLKWELNNYDI
jgi:hypothetical protein